MPFSVTSVQLWWHWDALCRRGMLGRHLLRAAEPRYKCKRIWMAQTVWNTALPLGTCEFQSHSEKELCSQQAYTTPNPYAWKSVTTARLLSLVFFLESLVEVQKLPYQRLHDGLAAHDLTRFLWISGQWRLSARSLGSLKCCLQWPPLCEEGKCHMQCGFWS